MHVRRLLISGHLSQAKASPVRVTGSMQGQLLQMHGSERGRQGWPSVPGFGYADVALPFGSLRPSSLQPPFPSLSRVFEASSGEQVAFEVAHTGDVLALTYSPALPVPPQPPPPPPQPSPTVSHVNITGVPLSSRHGPQLLSHSKAGEPHGAKDMC